MASKHIYMISDSIYDQENANEDQGENSHSDMGGAGETTQDRW